MTLYRKPKLYLTSEVKLSLAILMAPFHPPHNDIDASHPSKDIIIKILNPQYKHWL
jgi:hypothetical protein